MIIVVATIRVHPDKAEVYEALLREIMPKARAVEPDLIFYEVGKSRTEPNIYRAIEAYKDEAAMKVHVESKIIRAAAADMFACIAGDITVQIHDTI